MLRRCTCCAEPGCGTAGTGAGAGEPGRRRWRRTYSFFFLGPQGQLRAYVGHESSYPTRARAHMSRQGGARWTESHSNILVEADFK